MSAEPARKKRRFRVHFQDAYCKGCGICTDMCPEGGLRMSDRLGPLGYFVAEVHDNELCNGCRFCEIACPDFAITVLEVTDE
jgi:2-oxoglutarate ferredoxin oxidoreductase subunit delta